MNEQSAIPKATIRSITLGIAPEVTQDVLLVAMYENIAKAMGVYMDGLSYDCTKINVSRNIQSNVYQTVENQFPGDSVGMYWALRGPITEDRLPEDTVELFDGFFRSRNDVSLPLHLVLAADKEAT